MDLDEIFMIGVCHKCHESGIEVMKTTVVLSEIGTAEIPLCLKCRNN